MFVSKPSDDNGFGLLELVSGWRSTSKARYNEIKYSKGRLYLGGALRNSGAAKITRSTVGISPALLRNASAAALTTLSGGSSAMKRRANLEATCLDVPGCDARMSSTVSP